LQYQQSSLGPILFAFLYFRIGILSLFECQHLKKESRERPSKVEGSGSEDARENKRLLSYRSW